MVCGLPLKEMKRILEVKGFLFKKLQEEKKNVLLPHFVMKNYIIVGM